MFVHLGTHLYGKVDQVPGLFYVATQFFQLQFVPLIPLGSYLVREGQEPKEGEGPGVAIGWSVKSILLAWVRLGLMIAATFALLSAALMFGDAKNMNVDPAMSVFPLGGGIFFLILLYLSYRCVHASPERALELARLAGIEPEELAAYFEHSKAVSQLLEEYNYDQEAFDR